MHENRNGVKLYDYVTRLVEVFGENAAIAFSYLLSTLFRDIIFRRTRHFPILNLSEKREQVRPPLPPPSSHSSCTVLTRPTSVSPPYRP